MSLLEAIVLGLVQGLTEFLPISSTAHLRIVPELLGWKEPGSAFSAVIQIGTLAAVLVYFRGDLWQTGRAWVAETLRGRFAQSHDGKVGWMMIAGTLPVVVCGLLFHRIIESDLRRLTIVATALIAFGLLLAAAEWYLDRQTRKGRPGRDLAATGWTDAIVVGLAQAVALIPGSSRSGMTLSAAFLRGMRRDAAARFSFLLSIPAVFAAGVYELYKKSGDLLKSQDDAVALVVATLVSAVVGYASIALLLRYLRTRTTYPFVLYRLLLGGLLMALVYQGKLSDAPPKSDSAAAGRRPAVVNGDAEAATRRAGNDNPPRE